VLLLSFTMLVCFASLECDRWAQEVGLALACLVFCVLGGGSND
jgi:hypothetical protein